MWYNCTYEEGVNMIQTLEKGSDFSFCRCLGCLVFSDLYPYVNIYASKKKDIYNKVAHQKSMEDDLIDAIREELKIPN